VSRLSAKAASERAIGVGALVFAILAPFLVTDFWLDAILTQVLIFGIAAASLIFLSAYGGMISLAQTALLGISAYMLGNFVTERVPGGETKGLTLGWDPTTAIVLAIVITTGVGLLFGALASRSFGIYFLMLTLTYGVIANLFFGSVTQFGGFSPIAGVNQYTPGWIGDMVNDRTRLYYIALIVAVLVYVLIRLILRTPFGLSLQGVRDEPMRMSSLGYNVSLHRMLAFTFGAFVAALAGILFIWWQGQIAPGDLGLSATITLLVMAVIGGLTRIEGAFVGALFVILVDNQVTNRIPSDGLPVIGGSFNTVIGLISLAIVVISPDGLLGLWDRLWSLAGRRRGGRDEPAVPAGSTAGRSG
jgi:branched-chain amino acid transport system permease protein